MRLQSRRRQHHRQWVLEWLENRTLLSGSPLDAALPLEFNAFQAAHVSHLLANPNEVDLYRVTLSGGDTVDAGVRAQTAGSGLVSLLRIVDAQGTPLALDDQEGGDPHLRFQAVSTGVYFIGVSSAPNGNYDPTADGSGVAGNTTGLYTLDVSLTTAAPLLPDLIGSSFRLGTDAAVPGDAVPVGFTVENRGAADPGNFRVDVLLSSSERFDNSTLVYRTFTRADLNADATGRRFAAPADYTITVPAGQATGPLFVGLRISADPFSPESNAFDQAVARRGANFESLAVLTPVPPGVADLSVADASLNTGANGVLLSAVETNTYQLTVTESMGTGQLIASVATTSAAFVPRLTLARLDGVVLIQSDSGRIVQHLQPGTFFLRVSVQAGLGSYRLSTQFTPTQPPFQPPGAGKRPTLAVADVNGDGFDDLITANYNDGSVSVLLGAGDGSFQAFTNFPVDAGPLGVAAADLNGDGIADIVTGNYLSNGTVSVLLGNGDGTFQPTTNFTTGDGALFPVIADINGDGRPDIITGNYRAGTVSVLRGNGNGTFVSQSEMTVGAYPAFVSVADINGDSRLDIISPNGSDSLSVLLNQGNEAGGNVTFQPQSVIPTTEFPFAIGIADFNGDGRPDLASAHRNDDTVRVQLGAGNGTFGSEVSFAVGDTPYAMIVADVNGDGRPDVAVANRNAGTVSVLLGKGDGTFQPQVTLPVGQRPLTIRTADVNHDGHPDILAANADDNSVSVLLGRGDGSFSFPAEAIAAAGKRPFLFAVGDLRGDGHADIVTANSSDGSVSILLGATSGSFQPHQTLDVGDQPIGVAMADFNGDGKLDLVVTNKADDTVGVLLALGAGGFGPQTTFGVGTKPLYVVTADLDGDGDMDIVVTNNTGTSVSVLFGNGAGSFSPQQELPTGRTTYGVAVADVNGDGKPDIVASNYGDDSISVLLGNGGGTFQDQQVVGNVGALPSALALGKVNGDNFLDIVVALGGDNKAAVLLGNGLGGFGAPQAFGTGGVPTGVALARFNNDTFLDVVVSNRADNNVSVLLGNGDGTLQSHQTFAVGRQPFSVAATDVTGDGRPDIITANASDSTVSVLEGHADGTFSPQSPFALGKRPYAVVVADVSGDGNPDTITANYNAGTVSVARGNGNGSFQSPQLFAVGSRPLAVALSDVNRDGRADLISANSADNTASVLLGNGDGTFQTQQVIAVGQRPAAVSVADANGDGIRDLLVANYGSNNVSVLLGRGDGSFRPQTTFAVGSGPNALSTGDFNGDQRLDLAVTNIFDNTTSVLRGNGDGTFQSRQTFPVGEQPYSIAVADVTGDGRLDVITANYGGNSVSVLAGRSDGSFDPQQVTAVGDRPAAVSADNVNGDARPDLIVTNRRDGTVGVLLNSGGGFAPQQTFAAGAQPVSTAVTNVNGDGRPNIITVNYSNSTPRVLLASSTSFNPTTPGNATEAPNTTSLADLNRDGVRDRVILDAAGKILFRKGLPGSEDAFAPPEILNPDRRARDLAGVTTAHGLVVAAADSSFDLHLSAEADRYLYTVSLYSFASGSVQRGMAFTSSLLPTRIIAADLTTDGLDDIVVANALDNSIQVSFQQPDGSFSAPITLVTGEAPSNLAATDVNADGRTDILVTNQASGDVGVFLNDISHSFSSSARFRAGIGLFGLDATRPEPIVTSLQQSVSMVAGDFLGSGRNDLVVVNRATHSFNVLPNNGRGGFNNPQSNLTTSTSDGFSVNNRPGAVVAGDFNRDGHLDVAVLMQDSGQVWIFAGHGDGTFRHTFTIAAGDQATGLSVVPGSGNGLLDLLVGNGFGDVLHLAGKGDGTFQIRGNRVSLSVVPDLFGSGQAGVLVGNQQDNRVTVQAQTSGGTGFSAVETLGADNESQLAPGDVQWSMLARGATIPDAVVVSTGGNAVIVYHTISVSNGAPVFSATPHTYFVGTAPASVTVADINGDAIPDMLVANRGSNDVSVLFGTYAANGEWLGNVGPRLRSGGAGPIAVAVRDLNGDLVPDLALTNGGSGTVTVLAGVGLGFFDDRQPRTLFNLGAAVDQPPTFQGDSGLGFAVTAAGELVRFNLSNPSGGAGVVFSGSQLVAARALSNGQVVVAVADGTVKILSPQGDHLIVTSELRAQSGAPALPSSLVVLQQASGQFQVLVSSQGSDTVSVFASVAVGLPSVTLLIPSQVINSQPSSAGLPNSLLTISTLLSLNSLTDSLSGTTGLSLAGFLSTNSLIFTTASAAALVAVEGNSYSTVAVLDFGSQQDDDSGDGRGRKPELSTRFPFGSTSPLTRFVIGIEEAILEFADDVLFPEDGEVPLNDPWNEEIFQRRPPVRPPARAPKEKQEPPTQAPKTEAPPEGADPFKAKQSRLKQGSSPAEQALFDSFWEEFADEDLWLVPSSATRDRADAEIPSSWLPVC
ncbi:MAG: VCBS repeat-containing protein [Planctomycetales bacterium]|nr:VCBS repeat-containing protein [Planctomycetales bacterium]